MIRAVGERDYSAQETAHMLLSLLLTSCTFSFATLSLTRSHQLSKDETSGQLQIQESLYDHYATREGHQNMSLLRFATEYTVCKGEVRQRSSAVIVRTIPNSLTLVESIIKHKLWHGDPSSAWGGVDGSAEVWIGEYHRFLHTDTARDSIPHLNQDLLLAEQRLKEEENDQLDDNREQQSHQQDQWMHLCQLHPHFNMPPSEDAGVDWAEFARQLPANVVRSSPNWISSQRTLSEDAHNSQWCRQLPAVDPSTLNHKQRLA